MVAVVADAGLGIRKGQKLALPDIPCRGDVFHGLRMVTEFVVYLENRAYAAISACDKLEQKQAQHEHRQGRCDLKLKQHIIRARTAKDQAICLADDVALLFRWLQGDIFAVAGPLFSDRCVLYDFLVEELRAREKLCTYRIGKLATALTNQRHELLAFAAQLDRDLQTLADEFEVSLTVVRQVLQMQALDPNHTRRWQEISPCRNSWAHAFITLRKRSPTWPDKRFAPAASSRTSTAGYAATFSYADIWGPVTCRFCNSSSTTADSYVVSILNASTKALPNC